MPLSSVEGQVGVNSHQTGPDVCHRGSIIPSAIGAILVLAGVFLFLASYQVFPAGANAISNLGGWGESLSFCLMTGGGIALFLAYVLFKARKNDSDDSPREFCAPSTHTTSASTIGSSFREPENERKKIEKSRQELGLEGKSVQNTRALTSCFAPMTKLQEKLTEITLQRVGNNLNLSTSKSSLSKCISDYVETFKEGKNIIAAVNQSSDQFGDAFNMKAASKLNQGIDSLRDQIAVELAQEYADHNGPPSEFTSSLMSDVLKELDLSWRKYVKRLEEESPKRESDGKVLSSLDIANHIQQLKEISGNISKIGESQEDEDQIKSTLSECVSKYIEICTNGKMVKSPIVLANNERESLVGEIGRLRNMLSIDITSPSGPSDMMSSLRSSSTKDHLAYVIDGRNGKVDLLNLEISTVEILLVAKLARIYPDSDNPPAQFTQESKSEALTQLEASWREALATAKSL